MMMMKSVSSRVCATGHMTDPVPQFKSRALCPGGRFLPSFIHQVITITVTSHTTVCSRPEDGLRCRQGV